MTAHETEVREGIILQNIHNRIVDELDPVEGGEFEYRGKHYAMSAVNRIMDEVEQQVDWQIENDRKWFSEYCRR